MGGWLVFLPNLSWCKWLPGPRLLSLWLVFTLAALQAFFTVSKKRDPGPESLFGVPGAVAWVPPRKSALFSCNNTCVKWFVSTKQQNRKMWYLNCKFEYKPSDVVTYDNFIEQFQVRWAFVSKTFKIPTRSLGYNMTTTLNAMSFLHGKVFNHYIDYKVSSFTF